ncbi:MAG TPA: hypothetical protein VNW92_01175 [Polyangiaceae bacterium]|jgi:hypothetical protein|nr:hypothetical protein [Polyangiaceae bacterium]
MIERVYFVTQTMIGDRLNSFWHDPGHIDYESTIGVALIVKQEDGRNRKIVVPFTNIRSVDHIAEFPPKPVAAPAPKKK